MNLGLLCGVNQVFVFQRRAYFRISGVFGQHGDEGDWDRVCGGGVRDGAKKGNPKGEGLLGVNRESSVCVLALI